jgi:hypothetical protein
MVMVLVELPLATKLVGLAPTVEVLGSTGELAKNSTEAVSTTFTVPFTTALSILLPVVVEDTLPEV